MIKYCTECLHFQTSRHLPPMCWHPDARLLTGQPATVVHARYDGRCGPDGKLYTPRPVPTKKVPWWRRIFRRKTDD